LGILFVCHHLRSESGNQFQSVHALFVFCRLLNYNEDMPDSENSIIYLSEDNYPADKK